VPPAARTPPPLPASGEKAEQRLPVIGLDEDDNLGASAAMPSAAHASAGIDLPFAAKVMASLRADLLQQQIKPAATTAAGTDNAASSSPLVEVDVACRSVNAVLATLEGRLARYHVLEQRLTAASDMAHVQLNVGGERFHTTVTTLCKEPSYLQGMFSGYAGVCTLSFPCRELIHLWWLPPRVLA